MMQQSRSTIQSMTNGSTAILHNETELGETQLGSGHTTQLKNHPKGSGLVSFKDSNGGVSIQ